MAAEAAPQRRMARSELMLAIYVPAVLLAFGQGILQTTLPIYATGLGVSYTMVSLVVSAASLGTLATDVPAGMILARVGLKRSMVGGTALVVLGTIPLAFLGGFWLVIALQIAAGVGTACWGLSRHAFIAAVLTVNERGKVMSTFGGLNRIGLLLGPATGGFIAAWFGIRWGFLASGVLAVIALAFSVRYIRVTDEMARPRKGRWDIVGSTLRDNRRVLAAAASGQIFAQALRAGRFLLIPLYGIEHLGLGAAQVGVVMTAGIILDVAMFIPAGILIDRFGRKTAMVPSFAIMAIGVGFIPFAHSFAQLVAVSLLVGFGSGIGSGTMLTLGADLAPQGAVGEFLGLWRLVGDIGAVGGPIAVGAIAGAIGFTGSTIVLSVIGFTAAAILGLVLQETRETGPVAAAA